MKIDMTPTAVTLRLKQVAKLRLVCLSLAKSSKGHEIRKKHTAIGIGTPSTEKKIGAKS